MVNKLALAVCAANSPMKTASETRRQADEVGLDISKTPGVWPDGEGILPGKSIVLHAINNIPHPFHRSWGDKYQAKGISFRSIRFSLKMLRHVSYRVVVHISRNRGLGRANQAHQASPLIVKNSYPFYPSPLISEQNTPALVAGIRSWFLEPNRYELRITIRRFSEDFINLFLGSSTVKPRCLFFTRNEIECEHNYQQQFRPH